MKKIVYPPKFYLFDLILSLFGIAFSAIAFYVLDKGAPWLIWIFYFGVAAISLYVLFSTLWNIQWICLDKAAVSAHNVFGLIKRLEFSKVQSAKEVDAYAFGIRTYSMHYPCSVVSSRKNINRSDIEDAFNHRKSYYVILPFTNESVQMLQSAYTESVGESLEIKRKEVKRK